MQIVFWKKIFKRPNASSHLQILLHCCFWRSKALARTAHRWILLVFRPVDYYQCSEYTGQKTGKSTSVHWRGWEAALCIFFFGTLDILNFHWWPVCSFKPFFLLSDKYLVSLQQCQGFIKKNLSKLLITLDLIIFLTGFNYSKNICFNSLKILKLKNQFS